MVTIQQILQKVRSYDPQANLDLIQRAYAISLQQHAGQKRASGQPYVIHPLEVAAILCDMKLDVASIAAGLLHDTVEDTHFSIEDVEKNFNHEIMLLVDGVTKLSRINFSSSEEKQAENFRKMILAMAADIRVVLIKLADRLNNMRTLSHLSLARQRKIATETLEIYAPLANRLGIQWMKVELEDLCLKHLKPEVYHFIEKSSQEQKRKKENYIDRVKSIIAAKLSTYHVSHQIFGRLKHPYSIYRKMEAQSVTFDQVHDVIAFRIIVETIRQCYEALGVIHELWKPIPGRFKDYIAMPKVNNYQSLHTTVICLDGQRVEFQIRTRLMNEVAESGIAAHWNYKEDGDLSKKDQKKFQWLRDLIDLQKDVHDPAEFLDTVKLDLFATDIYVFTPGGKLLELTYGSCPIDFAYSIHTDVGNQCVGAKIDDRIVPLDHQLHSGDTVTILTKPNSHPHRDWLKFVKTSRAKAKIRQEIQREQRDRAIQLGKELLSREIERQGQKAQKYLQELAHPGFVQDHFGLQSVDSILAQVGYGKITVLQVIHKLLPRELVQQQEAQSKPTIFSEMIKKAKRKSKSGIKVSGYDDILVTTGKCCHPLPGDSITGFITRGRGVIIHKTDCPKVLATDPERRIDVSWNQDVEILHATKIKIVCVDKPGILANLTKKISALGVNISQANIRTTDDEKAINIFTVEVRDRIQLEQLIRTVETVKGVISVGSLKS